MSASNTPGVMNIERFFGVGLARATIAAARYAAQHVFGYPRGRATATSSRKVIHEVKWLGVPPVVFPYAGVRYLLGDAPDSIHSLRSASRLRSTRPLW